MFKRWLGALFNRIRNIFRPSSPSSSTTEPSLPRSDIKKDDELSFRAKAQRRLAQDGYEFLRSLGKGSFGEVWLVRTDVGIKAAKVVTLDQCGTEKYDREFRALRHREKLGPSEESLIQIYHVKRHDDLGFYYYIMPHADDAHGAHNIDPSNYEPMTLSFKANRRPMPAEECARIGHRLLDAVAYLDKNDLSHCDIKPSNVVFIREKAVLADLGLLDRSSLDGSDEGTNGFTLPGEGGTLHGDLYSLGKTLYVAFTGNPAALCPRSGKESNRVADQRLFRVIKIACDKDTEKRFVNIKAFRLGLDNVLKDEMEPHPTEKKPKFWPLPSMRRRPTELNPHKQHFIKYINDIIDSTLLARQDDRANTCNHLTTDELASLNEGVGREFERRIGYVPREFKDITTCIQAFSNSDTRQQPTNLRESIISTIRDLVSTSPAKRSQRIVTSLRDAINSAVDRLWFDYADQFKA